VGFRRVKNHVTQLYCIQINCYCIIEVLWNFSANFVVADQIQITNCPFVKLFKENYGQYLELSSERRLIGHLIQFGIPIKQIKLQELSLNVTCGEGRTVRYLCDVYRSEFGVEQEDIRHSFVWSVYGVRHWGGSGKLERIEIELILCYLLMMLIDWEKTNTFSVKEMKEGLSWSLAMRLG